MSKDLYKEKLNEMITKWIQDGANPDHIFLALTELSLEYLDHIRSQDKATAWALLKQTFLTICDNHAAEIAVLLLLANPRAPVRVGRIAPIAND